MTFENKDEQLNMLNLSHVICFNNFVVFDLPQSESETEFVEDFEESDEVTYCLVKKLK